jgi:glycosyltransferase involved in cell wall biosynthesis
MPSFGADLKVVLVHNYLRSSGPSGENLAYQEERDLLRRYGHEVVEFTVTNDDLEDVGWTGNFRAAATAPWSFSARSRLRRVLRNERPGVVHIHNTFPLLSPSVFWAARGLPCASVITLHNYRIFCAAGVPLRDGRPCTECLEKHSSVPALRYGCYRASRLATLPLSFAVALHRVLGTWRTEVDAFICLTEFQREMMRRAGLADEALFVKPHCYLDPPSPLPWPERQNKVVFLGRLGPEKGVAFLLEAWRLWGDSAPLLEIIGDGPEEDNLRGFAEKAGIATRVVFRGRLPFTEAQRLLGRAKAAVLPSVSYEGFPMVIREAFALGAPIVGSRIGSIQTLVSGAVNGALFEPGDAADLLRVVQRLWADDGQLMALASGARATFEEKYTAELNHGILMRIYDAAIQRRREKLAHRQARS